MSTLIMSACWPLQMPPTPKAVLISLADNANDQGVCWPSLSTISTRTCFGKTAVIEAIRWLEEKGVLIADRSNGRHTSYELHPEALAGAQLGTSPAGGPVRQADRLGPKPVREADRSGKRTGPGDGQNLSASRTQPVRETDTNRKEPSGTKSKTSTSKVLFKTWIAEIPEGEAIPANDPIFDWASKAQIPEDWIELAWRAFEDKYADDPKTYLDWRAVFRNAVKGNWLRLWWSQPTGGYALTTVGETWRRVHNADQQQEAA